MHTNKNQTENYSGMVYGKATENKHVSDKEFFSMWNMVRNSFADGTRSILRGFSTNERIVLYFVEFMARKIDLNDLKNANLWKLELEESLKNNPNEKYFAEQNLKKLKEKLDKNKISNV